MMASSVVIGPLGNYCPLMIALDAWRSRASKLSALGLSRGYMVIFSALLFGGFPTGWTGYAPLQTQPGRGGFRIFFGFLRHRARHDGSRIQFAATIINYRAPGMTWSACPSSCGRFLATAACSRSRQPVLVAGGLFRSARQDGPDRLLTSPNTESSSYLWQNLFWFFGHPEV